MDRLISLQAAIDIVHWYYSNMYGEDAEQSICESIENLPSAAPEIIRCEDCTHYHEDVWGDEIGKPDIPLILAHEMCDFWGRGCKTKKDAFCSYAERRTNE